MKARRWSELSDGQQTALLVMVSVQLSLSATAWVDLVTRPAALVNGRKGVWAAVIGVNFVGPIAYFARGRRPRVEDPATGSRAGGPRDRQGALGSRRE